MLVKCKGKVHFWCLLSRFEGLRTARVASVQLVKPSQATVFATISFGTNSGASVLVTSQIYIYSFRICKRIQSGFLSYQTENSFTKESRWQCRLLGSKKVKKSWPWWTGSGLPSPQRHEILCCPVTETCRSTMSGKAVVQRWFRWLSDSHQETKEDL